MTRSTAYLLLALPALLLAPCAPSHAEPVHLECPATLDVTTSVPAAPPGWNVVPGESRLRFDSLKLFDGPPQRLAALAPTRGLEAAPKGARSGASQWRFEGGARDIWLGCFYQGSTSALAMRIPDGAARCTVRAQREAWGWQNEPRVICDKP